MCLNNFLEFSETKLDANYVPDTHTFLEDAKKNKCNFQAPAFLNAAVAGCGTFNACKLATP